MVKDFDIYLDPPTGLVFVKLPQGWKFVGKVEGVNLSSSSPTVFTTLLPEQQADTVMANATPPSK
jgi:hypothetical protein